MSLLSSVPSPRPSAISTPASAAAGIGRKRPNQDPTPREGFAATRSADAPEASSSSDSARTVAMTRSRMFGGALSCGAALSSACETKPSSPTFSAQSLHSATW